MNESEEKTKEDHIVDLMVKKINLMKKGAEKVLQKNKKRKAIEKFINWMLEIYHLNLRVFIMGEGRSGLVGEGFAMRLRQMGFHAHVIGESTTPRVRKRDLVIVISGSGATSTNVARCEIIINQIKARIILITANPESILGRLADLVVELLGRDEVLDKATIDYNKKRLIGDSILPLRTYFEALAGIFLDTIIEELMEITETTEQKMKERHSI